MPLRIVQSQQNPRLKQLRRMLAKPRNQGLAGIEGPHLVREALGAGLTIRSVFVGQGSERLVEDLSLPASIDVLVVPRRWLDASVTTEAPQPVAALVETPAWTWAQLIPELSISGHPASGHPNRGHPDRGHPLAARAALIVVLAGLQDPGNLGTILRSAEAFGATGVVSLPGTVSAWNPKAVRASAGSVFRVPLVTRSPEECLGELREAGVKILSSEVRGARAAGKVDLAAPVAIVIGNEGSGVPEDFGSRADQRITLPCPGPVESLNAAVAASVLLYEASRQRSECGGRQRG